MRFYFEHWFTLSKYKDWFNSKCLSTSFTKLCFFFMCFIKRRHCKKQLYIPYEPSIYSSANKIFAVLRRNRSDPLSRAMGCIGELRAGSRSEGYERFGTGNLAPLAVLVPIPKPATHSKGVSNQHPHCTVYIWMYHVGSHWIAVKYVQEQVNYQTSLS